VLIHLVGTLVSAFVIALTLQAWMVCPDRDHFAMLLGYRVFVHVRRLQVTQLCFKEHDI
jgi:hypothetical protein